MQRMRTLAVLATIAIVAAATPPPTAASPPTFMVEPISSLDNGAAPVAANQANFMLTISPQAGDVNIEPLAVVARTTSSIGTPETAEPSSALTPASRSRPRTLTTKHMAAEQARPCMVLTDMNHRATPTRLSLRI